MRVQNVLFRTAFVLILGFDVRAADVLVELKTPASEKSSRSHYKVTSGDIDGQATVSAVSGLAEAQALVNAEIVGVKSTFNNSNAPYGGHITSTIKCYTHKYLQEKEISFEGEKTEAVLAVASNRKIFGICAADEVKFAAAVWAAFDKSKNRVLSVKLFKPITDVKQIDKAQKEILTALNKTITHL